MQSVSSSQPLTSFSGLASGLDTASIVDGLVKVEQIPIQRLQQKQDDLNSISSRLGTLNTRLSTLGDKARALNDAAGVLTSAASSSSGAVTATAAGGASLGTYDIEVTSLAKAERTYSDTFSDSATAGLFGSGTLDITVGSAAAVSVTVTASDTLSTVVDKINSSGADVTAGIVYDGTNYRLQVSGNKTGAANAVTFTETGTTLGLDNPANELVSASDAVFTVDTIAMTRSTNSFSDAIPGVTLNLTGTTASGSPATVTVSRDAEAFADKMQEFVDAYNTATNGINVEFAFLGQAKTGDSLSGDSMLRRIQSELGADINTPVSGVTGAFTMLAQMGVHLTRTGSLEMDRQEVIDAVNSDGASVSELLIGDSTAGVTGFMDRIAATTDQYADASTGLLTDRISGIADQVSDIDDDISSMQDRIDKYAEGLRRKFAVMETMIASLQSQGQQMLAALGAGTTTGG